MSLLRMSICISGFATIVDKRMDSEIIVWYNLYSCHSFGKNNFFVDYVC